MTPKLSVRDLGKSYGATRAVRGVSFDLGEGEIFGLLGPNGAGKTTIIECVCGLRDPDTGTIAVCGFDPATQPAGVKTRIGVALQSTALHDRVTPREALDLFGAFYPRAIETGALLARFALVEKADAPFETLSGGQRQRLALALAFLNAPELLILDEPTAGLDPQSRRECHAAIRRFRDEGHTVLLTTHYLEEAQTLCDRVAVLHAGQIVAVGNPDELIGRSRAATRIVARTARPVDLAAIEALPMVTGAETIGDEVTLKTEEVGAAVIALVRALEAERNELLDLRVEKPSLEDIFLELTRHLADADAV